MNTPIRKDKQYRITIEELSPESGSPKTLQFEYEDREDFFNTRDKINQGSGLDEVSATRLTLALRLLGPMMMKDRKHPLFVDFMPHFKNFMQNLKATVKKSIAEQD